MADKFDADGQKTYVPSRHPVDLDSTVGRCYASDCFCYKDLSIYHFPILFGLVLLLLLVLFLLLHST